jgi:hypothetical protein
MMVRRSAQNEGALRELVALLSRGHFMTVRQITVEMRCSKPVAYRRLRRLLERGCVFQTCSVREGATGPRSTGYVLRLRGVRGKKQQLTKDY